MPEQVCPICAAEVTKVSRYPNYVCDACQSRMVGLDHKKLSFSNVDVNSDEVTPSAKAFIDGIEVFATTAHFGGIVIRPLLGDK